MAVTDLSNLDVDEVSVVRRGAIGKIFALFKSAEDGSVELEKATVEALATPLADEARIVEALKADGFEDAALEAEIASRRLAAFAKASKKKPADDDSDADAENDGDEDDVAKDVMPKSTMDMGDDNEWSDDMDADAMPDADEIAKRDFNAAERKNDAKSGAALPDGSFPIENKKDLSNAIRAIGRAKDKAKAKAHIISRARSLGATSLLPDGWVSKSGELASGSNDDKERSMGDSPGVPVLKEDGSWDLSGVAPEHRAFYDSVAKSLDDAKAESARLAEDVKKAEEKRAELEDRLVEKELIQKAEGEFSHVAKSDELLPVLKAAKESFDADTFEKFEELLKAANGKIEAGALFAELGKSGEKYLAEAKSAASVAKATGGDAWDKIEAGAAALVEKSENLTQEQAVDRFLKTAEGKALYAEYMADRGVAV